MVTCIMPSDTSDHCAFDASLRISWDRRESKSHCQRRTTEDRFHCGQLLFCLIDDLWFCSRDGRHGVLAAANVGVRTDYSAGKLDRDQTTLDAAFAELPTAA